MHRNQREYDLWNEELTAILNGNERLTKKELADLIANSPANRQQLLKLLFMNNYDMEANSRQELLDTFKQSYGGSVHLMCMLLRKFCPDLRVTDIQKTVYGSDFPHSPSKVIVIKETLKSAFS